MPKVRQYRLPPTSLIPNSPWPLLHYPGLLLDSSTSTPLSAPRVHDLFTHNLWQTQWIFEYGASQRSHYHSRAHECMAVLSGTATIRFGVADTTSSEDPSAEHESPGIELQAHAGDVFVLPAGTAHKTFNPGPDSSFALLTPGNGHGIVGDGPGPEGVRRALEKVSVSGFAMIGAYPEGGEWDFREGGEDVGEFERVWAVKRPARDPVLGLADEGICGQWR